MGLRLFFLQNIPGATFIQGGTFIPESRVCTTLKMTWSCCERPGYLGLSLN